MAEIVGEVSGAPELDDFVPGDSVTDGDEVVLEDPVERDEDDVTGSDAAEVDGFSRPRVEVAKDSMTVSVKSALLEKLETVAAALLLRWLGEIGVSDIEESLVLPVPKEPPVVEFQLEPGQFNP